MFKTFSIRDPQSLAQTAHIVSIEYLFLVRQKGQQNNF